MKTLLAFLLCAISAQASVVTFTRTNSTTGLPDTNVFRVYAVSQIVNSDGSFNTIGFPNRVTPDSNGVASVYLRQNNYLATNNNFWLAFQVPDNTSNSIVASDWMISGGNYFVTRLVNTNGGSSGSATNVNFLAGSNTVWHTQNGSNVVDVLPTAFDATGSASNAVASIPVSSTITNGLLTTNQFPLYQLAVMKSSAGAASPPFRFNSWYSGYGGGGSGASSSNMVYYEAAAAHARGLDLKSKLVIQIDDYWTTNRDGSGNLVPSGAFGGLSGFETMVNWVHTNYANIQVGIYFECNSNGVTSAGGVGTDPSHLQQDATNAANWGIDYVKYDGADNMTYTAILHNLSIFSYYYKSTAAALGQPAYIHADVFGPGFGGLKWSLEGNGPIISAICDTWNPSVEIQGKSDGSGYTNVINRFDTNIVPFSQTFMKQGSYMEFEGLTYAYFTGFGTTNLQSQLSLDAMQVMWNFELEFGTVDNAAYLFVQTNSDLLYLDQHCFNRPILCYQNQNTNATLQVWKKLIGQDTYAIHIWNRSYTDSQSIALTRTMLGIPPLSYNAKDVFYQTNSTFSGSTTINLGPAQSVLLILSPSNPNTLLTGSGVASATTNSAGQITYDVSGTGSGTNYNLANSTNLPVAGIQASGTPSSTTYLRGDGSWSTPAGGSTLDTNALNSFLYGVGWDTTNHLFNQNINGGNLTFLYGANIQAGSIQWAALGSTITDGITNAALTIYARNPSNYIASGSALYATNITGFGTMAYASTNDFARTNEIVSLGLLAPGSGTNYLGVGAGTNAVSTPASSFYGTGPGMTAAVTNNTHMNQTSAGLTGELAIDSLYYLGDGSSFPSSSPTDTTDNLGFFFMDSVTGQFGRTYNGSVLTNTPITLGQSSILSSNGATASWMLGVDSTGKVTTNAVPTGTGGSATNLNGTIVYTNTGSSTFSNSIITLNTNGFGGSGSSGSVSTSTILSYSWYGNINTSLSVLLTSGTVGTTGTGDGVFVVVPPGTYTNLMVSIGSTGGTYISVGTNFVFTVIQAAGNGSFNSTPLVATCFGPFVNKYNNYGFDLTNSVTFTNMTAIGILCTNNVGVTINNIYGSVHLEKIN